MPSGGLKPIQLRPNKRSRRRNTKMSTLDEVDEEHMHADAATVSTAASAASSAASNTSQPPLLDFIGTTCLASSWFTSCFPCAVVDINDSDDYVVDKLSRESAMNVMYATQQPHNGVSGTRRSSPVSDAHPIVSERQDENLIYIRLPAAQETAHEHQTAYADAPIPFTPPLVADKNSQEDEEMLDTISLEDDAGYSPMMIPVTPPRSNSGSMDTGGSRSFEGEAVEEHPLSSPLKSPPKKKKKKFGMKIFARKTYA